MTDPSTPSTPEPNTPPPASSTPPPAASTPPAYTPSTGTTSAAGTPGAKKGLSLAGFIVGIASVVLFLTSWFAILVGVVGLVLSLIARSKEPGSPNWMKLLGLIFSIVGILLGAIVLIIGIIALASLGDPSNYSN